jgi:PST family polysaccharide transporter
MIVVGLGDVFVNLGLGPSLIQRNKITTRHVRVVFTTSVAAGILLTILTYTSATQISLFFENENVEPVLQTLSVLFIISGLQIPSQALLRKELQFRSLFYVNFSQTAIYGVIAVGLALTGYGVWSLVIGNIVKKGVGFLGSYWKVMHEVSPLISINEINDLFRFGSGMTLSGVFNYFARQGDYFVIGKLLGTNTLGLYTKAYTLMQIPTTYFVRVLSDVSFPTASLIQDDNIKLQSLFLKVTGLISFIILPSTFVMCVAAEEIIVGLYGSNWYGAVVPFQILVLFGLFRACYNNYAAFLRAKGWVYSILCTQIFYGLAMIVLVWYGSIFYGLKGASLGSGISIFLMFLMIIELSVRALKITRIKLFKVFIPSVILTISILPQIILLRYILVSNEFSHLIIAIIVAIYSVISFILLAKYLPKNVLGDIPEELFTVVYKYIPKKYVQLRKFVKYG